MSRTAFSEPPALSAATCRSPSAARSQRGYEEATPESPAAAEELAAEGIEVEALDPRTLVPFDLDAILSSVARTHRVVVAHEAVLHGGFGAEVAAQVQAAAFDDLDAPVVRVGAPFAPIPFSPPLEDAYLPGRADVAAAVRRTLAGG
jgi:acetoin:2,6-dichlorophenolindophenol oxidoreductase subunit beta